MKRHERGEFSSFRIFAAAVHGNPVLKSVISAHVPGKIRPICTYSWKKTDTIHEINPRKDTDG